MTKKPHLKLLLLLGITLLAAFLRLYQIDTIPPGGRYDPAYYGVDALHILEGERPIFLATNFGREVLFSYLVALCIAILGPVSYSMYLTSAIVGILTVPAVYLLAEELFAEEDGVLGDFGGLVSALALAVSYWHLNWSRFGVRAILLPLFAALTFFFLWRGLRTNARRHFVAAGFFLGLGAYTYQAARILPVLVVLAFAYFAAWRRCFRRQDSIHLAIVALVALIVFAPLAYYFVTHPGSFSQRIEQASVLDPSQELASNLKALGNGIVDILESLSFSGDEEPTTNLPGRPSLNGFFSILLCLGVFASLFRIKKPASQFLLSWLVVMSIPAILSQFGSIAKRMIGTLPAIMILIAIGTLVPWGKLNQWAARRGSRWARTLAIAILALIVAGFVYSAMLTYRDYFVVWARDPDLFTHFEVGPAAIGQYAGTLPPEENVYISPITPEHPAVIYYSHHRPGIKGYDGRVCMVVPGRALVGTTYVIVPGEDPNSLEALPTYFPQGGIVAQGPLHYGEPYLLAFRVPQGSEAAIAPSHPLEATWGSSVKLLGYDLDADSYRPGDTIHLTLYYQALEEMDRDYTVFTQILGPDNPATGGPLWGQSDSEPCQRAYPTSAWTTGEIVQDQFAIPLAADAPPGEYQLQAGLYLLETMTRLPASSAGGERLPGDAVLLGTMQVEE